MKLYLITFAIIFFIPFPVSAEIFTIQRVIDGNTLELTNGDIVTLIGVDAPENKLNAKARADSKKSGVDIKEIIKMGKDATEVMKLLIQDFKEVRLEFDKVKRGLENNLLAYVWLQTKSRYHLFYSDGSEEFETREFENLLNKTIISVGYASTVKTLPNIKYADLFERQYQEARKKKIGLWGSRKGFSRLYNPD